jgi:hypothetical protein
MEQWDRKQLILPSFPMCKHVTFAKVLDLSKLLCLPVEQLRGAPTKNRETFRNSSICNNGINKLLCLLGVRGRANTEKYTLLHEHIQKRPLPNRSLSLQ